VPIDRAATVRNAEKLIRQGKLDAAITEYVRIVEDQPQDWAAKNTLGDMYARAGQIDKAVQQFGEIANNLSDEGAMARPARSTRKSSSSSRTTSIRSPRSPTSLACRSCMPTRART